MNRAEKQDVVKELNETFKGNSSVLLINFTGVNVEDSTNLRRKISEMECGYRVIKNRLALRALEDTSLEELKEHFEGPTAIAYTGGDPVALARVLKAFIKDHPAMSFKAGIVEGQAVSASEMDHLAGLPSRPELLTKLLYLLNAPLTHLATALQSPLRDLASVLSQLGEKREQDQPQAAEPQTTDQQTTDQEEAGAQTAEPEVADQEEVAEQESAEPQTTEPQTTDQEADTDQETIKEEAPEKETTDQKAAEAKAEQGATEEAAPEETPEPEAVEAQEAAEEASPEEKSKDE
jgi:large subunit ribosomal protein L10